MSAGEVAGMPRSQWRGRGGKSDHSTYWLKAIGRRPRGICFIECEFDFDKISAANRSD